MLKRFAVASAAVACMLSVAGPGFAQDLLFNQNVTPDVIATAPLAREGRVIDGDVAGNGGYTVDRRNGVELGLRARFNGGDASTVQDALLAGDNRYFFPAGNAPGETGRVPTWVFDWSINADPDSDQGRNLNALTYEIFVDGDPGPGTDFLSFDPLGAPPVGVAFDIRCLIAFGNNNTGLGGGVAAGPGCTTQQIVQLRNNNNVKQSSCDYDCPRLDQGPLAGFDPNLPGIYTLAIEAREGGVLVARTEIEVIVGDVSTVSLEGFGSDTLSVEFSTDVVASGGAYDGQTPESIAAGIVTDADKQAFLDEFFEIRVSIGGIPTLVPAAALDADWSQVLINGSSDSLSVTFEAGVIGLDFSLDQGNTGATRIDVEWTGTAAFVTQSGGQPLVGPDAADNPFKVEFEVPYSLDTGPAYGPATATFIDRTTLLQRPFVTGIRFGGVARAPVAVEFAAGVSAEVTFDGVTEPYLSGTDLTVAGSYRIVATNDSNLSVEPGAQTALEFTIVEPAGTLVVTADGAPLDGQAIGRGDSRLLNIAANDVDAPLGAELAVVFDGLAPGDASARDGNEICAELLEAADCTALAALLSLTNTFTEDLELFNDSVTVLESAEVGSWILRFFLVEVVDGAIAGVVDQLDATIEVLEGADLALSIDGPGLLPVGEQGIYAVNLSNLGDAATVENVEVQFTVSRPGIDLEDLAVEFCQDSASAGAPDDCTWLPLSFVSDNGSLSSRFGPPAGFPVPVDYDVTTFIRATFAVSGNYAVQADVVGIDSASVLASDAIDIAVPALTFEIEEGVAADVDDSDIGFGYFTAELANLGDDLPELVRLYIEVRDSEDSIVDDDNRFEFWNADADRWDSLAYDSDLQRWAFGPAAGFEIEAGYFAATAVRADFPNDVYELIVTVETADRDADPILVYGLFERSIAIVTEPEGELAAQINGADADGQSLTVGDAFGLELTAADVLPRSGQDLFVVFDGQRPSDSGNQPGEDVCLDLLQAADCAALAAAIGFANALDAGDSTLFDDEVSLRPDAEIGTWTLNFFLVEALDDGAGGSTPGQVVDTLSVELTIDEATAAIDGLGTDTLTIEFSTDVVASGGLYDGLSPAAIAAGIDDAADKQAFLDEFFEIRVSGVPTLVPASTLDADWTKVLINGTSDSLSVTFEAGVIELDFSLDQGNTGATRIDVEWTGTAAFVTESGGQPLVGPDAADNPFKVEFEVPYSLDTGPAYGPATATFIDRTTLLQRPFVTGIAFGAVTTDPVAIEFPAGTSATVSFNEGDAEPYGSGEPLVDAGDYIVLVTNDANPGIVAGAQTAVRFTIEPTKAQITIENLNQVFDGQPKPVTVTTVPAGLNVIVTYAEESAAPVNAGSYRVEVEIDENNFFGNASATLEIAMAQQTIDFAPLPDRTTDETPFNLTATATSGLAVEYRVVSGPATVDGNEVSLTGGLGEVVIEAGQPGDNNWLPADTVTRSFNVTAVAEPSDLVLTIEGPTQIEPSVEGFYAVRLENVGEGPGSENVTVEFLIERLGLSVEDIVIEFCADDASEPATCNDWVALLPQQDGEGRLIGRFGPDEGFATPVDYDETTLLRVRFDRVGPYRVTLDVLTVDSGELEATANIRIIVGDELFRDRFERAP